MKKLIIFGVILLMVVVGGVYLYFTYSAKNNNQTQNTNQSQQKSGEATKTGAVTQAGDKFYLVETGKEPIEISSYQIDLTQYVGRTVTITGQYSGETLFVGSVR